MILERPLQLRHLEADVGFVTSALYFFQAHLEAQQEVLLMPLAQASVGGPHLVLPDSLPWPGTFSEHVGDPATLS